MQRDTLTIKNDALGEILSRVIKEKPGEAEPDGKTDQEMGENLIAEYAMDMYYSGSAVGTDLDFTYDTLNDLPTAVSSCYRRYRKGDHPEYAVVGLMKSLAAYFFALAMNEHDMPWEVLQGKGSSYASGQPRETLWGVFRIQVGKKRKADFLLPVIDGCQVVGNAEKRLLIIDLTQLIREYKAVTKVDLKNKGVSNITFEL